MWLVAYSAIVRKKTRMPYVRVAKDEEGAATAPANPRFSGVAYNPATVPTSPVMQQVPVAMTGGRTMPEPVTTEVAPVQQQGTAV